jgi:cyanophycinase-like exopeptidase
LLQPLVLTEDELQLFDDAFEFRPTLSNGQTQRDSVYLAGSDAPSQALYRDFVAMAAQHSRKNKPRVLVITASSQNVFGSVYYYLSLFEQSDAAVDWLAIDPATARSRDCNDLDALRYAENGSYARAARYPELAAIQQDQCAHPDKMRALIDAADGIFIDGGDQTLTIRSLQLEPGVFTDLGKRLLARIDAGVPLGGTSAGTAVQSGNAAGTLPMISNGTTSHALRYGALAGEPSSAGCPMTKPCTLNVPTDQVTYRASGGLRTFDLGVLDTHFFERQREGRQVRLLLDSGTPFAFGIDESTVLHVRDGPGGTRLLNVQGHGGVWILDVRGATVESDGDHWQANGFHATRLLDGDSAVWKDGLVSVDLHCPATRAPAPSEGIDAEAFKAEDGREWKILPSDPPAQACRRDDGRWRYARLLLQLRQSLD